MRGIHNTSIYQLVEIVILVCNFVENQETRRHNVKPVVRVEYSQRMIERYILAFAIFYPVGESVEMVELYVVQVLLTDRWSGSSGVHKMQTCQPPSAVRWEIGWSALHYV